MENQICEIAEKYETVIDYELKTHRGYESYMWLKLSFDVPEEYSLKELKKLACKTIMEVEGLIGFEVSEQYTTIVFQKN